MSKDFQVGSLVAKVGEKIQGYLPVAGCSFGLPITLINGKKPGKTIIITGGTHGGEYPGIETAIRLAGELSPEEITGRLAVVHPVNMPAFLAKMQYVGPDDGKNLNREYPGQAMGTVTQRIAYTISKELFSQGDFYLDLHGGDIHEALTPFVFYSMAGTAAIGQYAKEVAAVMGIEYVVASHSATGAFGCAAVMGVPSVLAEIGGCGLWSEAEVVRYLEGVKNALAYLGTLSQEVADLGAVTYLEGMVGLNAQATGCWYPWVSLNQEVAAGEKIGEIKDYFGRLLGEYHAPQAGRVLYVITSLAINEGDPLIAIG